MFPSYSEAFISVGLLILFQVRVFNLSRLSGVRPREISMEPAAIYQCHSRRVKKLAVRSQSYAEGHDFEILNHRAWRKFLFALHLIDKALRSS